VDRLFWVFVLVVLADHAVICWCADDGDSSVTSSTPDAELTAAQGGYELTVNVLSIKFSFLVNQKIAIAVHDVIAAELM